MDENNIYKDPFAATPESEAGDAEIEINPVLAKHQTHAMQKTWCAEIENSRRERKNFDKSAEKTIKRYSDERGETESNRSYYNVFFANTEIKMAALYARTPVPDIKRRFNDADDDISRVAASLLQRNIVYELDADHFDETVHQILFDRLVPGVGIGWARLDEEIGEPEYAPMIDPMTGMPMIDPETGEPFLEPVEGSDIRDQLAAIDYVPWNDFLWAPCRLWSQCRWVARRIDLSKDEIEARFSESTPAQVLSDLNYSEEKTSDKARAQPSSNEVVNKTTCVFEIWDKERGLVWWISEQAEVPLDVQEDRMAFPDFFPTPLPPLGRFDTSSTQPISDFKLVQDQYNELDALNDRAAKKLQAIRTLWVYDAKQSSLADVFSAPEFQGLPIEGWNTLQTEEGGLRGVIEFMDNSPMVNEYMLLIDARDKVKAQIYELEGISDIMRGASQQYDTATATSAKASLGSTRLAVMMKDVADYIARLLRLKAHVICKFYRPERVLERAGRMPQTDERYIGQALELLGSAPLSHYRLSVSTDSLQLPNWNQEKAERSEAIQALTAMLGQIIPAAEQSPLLGVFGGHLARFGIAGFKGAEPLESALDAFLEQAQEDMRKNAGQPKPPSPAEIKAKAAETALQAEVQKTQIREQTNLQVAEVQAAAKREVAAMQAQVDMQKNALREQEIALNARMEEVKLMLAQAELQIKASRSDHENALDVQKLNGGA